MEYKRRESLKPEFIKFENEGDRVVGEYLSRDWYFGADGNKVTRHGFFDFDKESLVNINGTVSLNDSLSMVPFGECVEIVYVGETRTNRGHTVREFDVWSIDVPKGYKSRYVEKSDEGSPFPSDETDGENILG